MKRNNSLNLMLTSLMMVVLAGSVDCDQVIGGTIRGAVNQANTEAIRVSRILDAKDIEERINEIEEEIDSLENNELDLEKEEEELMKEEKKMKKKKKNKNKKKKKKNRNKNKNKNKNKKKIAEKKEEIEEQLENLEGKKLELDEEEYELLSELGNEKKVESETERNNQKEVVVEEAAEEEKKEEEDEGEGEGEEEEIEEEKEKEEEEEEEEVEIVPFVSDDCADTEGLIEVSDGGEKLNCREIRKTKICDRKHDGSHLYDSCQKSCGICLEAIPTTDAPTADLVELIVTENPTDESYKSYAPSYQPTIKFTDEPTESPSQYPTAYPTENEIAEILDGLDDDLLLEILGDGQ